MCSLIFMIPIEKNFDQVPDPHKNTVDADLKQNTGSLPKKLVLLSRSRFQSGLRRALWLRFQT